jgi:hypothetical protein
MDLPERLASIRADMKEEDQEHQVRQDPNGSIAAAGAEPNIPFEQLRRTRY